MIPEKIYTDGTSYRYWHLRDEINPRYIDEMIEYTRSPQWIPVSERGPEDNQHVALMRVYDWKDDEGNPILPFYSTGYAWYDYEFEFGEKKNQVLEFVDENGEDFDDYFTHWMPLPPAPGE